MPEICGKQGIESANLFALESNIKRLHEDHKRAMEIAEDFSRVSIIKNIKPFETNIVVFKL